MNSKQSRPVGFTAKLMGAVGVLLAGTFAPQATVQAWHRSRGRESEQERLRSSFKKEEEILKKVLLMTLCAAWFALAGNAFGQDPSGTVTIDEYELAYIFSGSMGGGKLFFQGNTYNFQIGGLGIGGIGATHLTASGEVYNLQDVLAFPGTYVQGSVGFSATNVGEGHLWLQNQNGVQLHLITSQQGLGLTTGASGIVINMTQ